MIYHTRRETVEAVQFNKFGDHPNVLKVQRADPEKYPYYVLDTPAMTEVKFGDYIINCEVGYIVMSKSEFEAKYVHCTNNSGILEIPIDITQPIYKIVLTDRTGTPLASYNLR